MSRFAAEFEPKAVFAGVNAAHGEELAVVGEVLTEVVDRVVLAEDELAGEDVNLDATQFGDIEGVEGGDLMIGGLGLEAASVLDGEEGAQNPLDDAHVVEMEDRAVVGGGRAGVEEGVVVVDEDGGQNPLEDQLDVEVENVLMELVDRVCSESPRRRSIVSSPKKEQIREEAQARIDAAKNKARTPKPEAPRVLGPRNPSPPEAREGETCRARALAVELNDAVLNAVARRAAKPRLTSPQRERKEHILAQPARRPRRSEESRAKSSSSEDSVLKAPADFELAMLKKKLEKMESSLAEEKKKAKASEEKAQKYRARAHRAGDEYDRLMQKREKAEKAQKDAEEATRQAEEQLLSMRDRPSELEQKLKDAEAQIFDLLEQLREEREKAEQDRKELEETKKKLKEGKAKAAQAEEAAERLRVQMHTMVRRAQLSPPPAAARQAIDLEPRLSAERSGSTTSEPRTPPASLPGSPRDVRPVVEQADAVYDGIEELQIAVQNPHLALPIVAQPIPASPPPAQPEVLDALPPASPPRAPTPPPPVLPMAGPGRCQACSTRITKKALERREKAARVRYQPFPDPALVDQMRDLLTQSEDLAEYVQSFISAAEISEELVDAGIYEAWSDSQHFVRYLSSRLRNSSLLEASRFTAIRRFEQLKEHIYDLGIPVDRHTRAPPATIHTTVLRDGTVAFGVRPRSTRTAAIEAKKKISRR